MGSHVNSISIPYPRNTFHILVLGFMLLIFISMILGGVFIEDEIALRLGFIIGPCVFILFMLHPLLLIVRGVYVVKVLPDVIVIEKLGGLRKVTKHFSRKDVFVGLINLSSELWPFNRLQELNFMPKQRLVFKQSLRQLVIDITDYNSVARAEQVLTALGMTVGTSEQSESVLKAGVNTGFFEIQKIPRFIIWIFVIAFGLKTIYHLNEVLFLDIYAGLRPKDIAGIILNLVLLSLPVYFSGLKFQTIMNKTGIELYFGPFVNKRIAWEEVKRIEVAPDINYYSPFPHSEYGMVYSLGGNCGLLIELKNGKKLFIGTKKEAELEQVAKSIEASGDLDIE